MKTNLTLRLLRGASATLFAVFLFLLWSVFQLRSQQPSSPQWNVSQGGQLARISSNEASQSKPIDAVNLGSAKSRINQDGAITGTVDRVFGGRENKVTIISFAANQRDAVAAVVKQENYTLFPVLQELQGRKLLITGKFELYRARGDRTAPQIELTLPSQIKVIE